MGNKICNKIYKKYTDTEVIKAVEIWYNINQANILECGPIAWHTLGIDEQIRAWHTLDIDEQIRVTKQFYKLGEKAERYLEKGRTYVKNNSIVESKKSIGAFKTFAKNRIISIKAIKSNMRRADMFTKIGKEWKSLSNEEKKYYRNEERINILCKQRAKRRKKMERS